MYNMDNDNDIMLVDSITIKVEPNETDDYHRINQIYNDGYQYVVKQEDAGKAILLIAKLHLNYSLPCVRVYPIRWGCVPERNVMTLENVAKEIEELSKRRNSKINSSANLENIKIKIK